MAGDRLAGGREILRRRQPGSERSPGAKGVDCRNVLTPSKAGLPRRRLPGERRRRGDNGAGGPP